MKEKELVEIQYGGNKFKTGDEVIISLRDSEFFKAKIYVEDPKIFYICHNKKEFEGNISPNRMSFKYSWIVELDENNTSVEPGDRLVILHKIENIETFKIISYPKLKHFVNHSLQNNPLFDIKLGVIDLYDRITEAKEQGFVEFHSKERNKKLKIKLGRLLRKLIVNYNAIIKDTKNNPIVLNDELIEGLHNKWVSYNLGIDSEIVYGKDILKGYTSKYYTKDKQFTSCMTDRFDFLKMYTDNPNQIGLMIFYLNHEVCGRCLVWTADDGKMYHDRVYYSHDWIRPAILATIEKASLQSITTNLTVTLDNIDFDYYPYMDTFCFGSTKDKKISNSRLNKSNQQYRSTGGSYQPL